MATIKDFEEIKAWQEARKFCLWVYHVTTTTGLKHNYKLRDQFDASSGSVMDNIAEGFERGTIKEFVQFLGYAKGSCGEARSQLTRIYDRGFIKKEDYTAKKSDLRKISGMLNKFIEYLKNSNYKGWRISEPVEEYGKQDND